MAFWIFKTEPSSYSYDDLELDGSTRWDGVRSAVALKHLRAVRRGDRAMVYHTGSEKAIVGLAKVATDPYPDPARDDERLVVVDLEPAGRLARAVPLAAVKADPALAHLGLVRTPRLSVVPVPAAHWKRLRGLGGV